jgi:hypothetical protein
MTGANLAMADEIKHEKSTLPSPANTGEASERLISHFWQLNRHTHFLALLVMAIATLGTSWTGFQAALWNGIETFRLADATRLSRLSTTNELTANQLRIVDAALFMEYARAYSEGNYKLLDFLRARMRPEFEPVMNAWLATKPLQNTDAPRTPFAMPEYRLQVNEEAAQQAEEAGRKSQEAQKANLNGDTYTLLTVLFSVSLFLAGLVTGFDESSKRWAAIGLSVLIIAMAASILVTLPIARRG